MKKKIALIAKIVAMAVLLVGIAFLIKDSSHQFRAKGYSSSAPTKVKFDKMKQWLPKDAELVLVVDPHRLFANDSDRARIAGWIEQGKSFAGMSAELIAHLVTNPGAIGLVAAGIELSPSAGPAEGVLVVQGGLDAKAMTDEITQQMAAAGVTLSKGDCAGIPFYVESTTPDAFALVFPDKHHMLLGTMRALESIMRCDEPTHGATPQTVDWYPTGDSKAVFGRLTITPQLASIFPEGLRGVSSVRISMGPEFVLHAEVPCSSTEQAHQAQLFFEGVRASLVMASMDKPELNGFLLGTQMIASPNSLRIAVPLNTVKSEM